MRVKVCITIKEDIGELIIKILKGIYEPLNKVYSIELQNVVKDILNINCEMRPDLNVILEKKFLLHYIKLTVIRQITFTGRKILQPKESENAEVIKKSSDKSDNKKIEFTKINQTNLGIKHPSNEYSSIERVLIDNSSNNSKVKMQSNLKYYMGSNNPSENNSFYNKSNSQSKSKSKELNDQKSSVKEPVEKSIKTSTNDIEKMSTKVNVEKTTSIDENINNFFNCVVEKKKKKRKSLETYSDISSASNIDFVSHKLDKNEEKSLFNKIEKLKTYLEKILGLETFIELYFKINVLIYL